MSNNIELWIELLRNAGFPIVTAAYLLLNLDKKVQKLTKQIEKLSKTIQKK